MASILHLSSNCRANVVLRYLVYDEVELEFTQREDTSQSASEAYDMLGWSGESAQHESVHQALEGLRFGDLARSREVAKRSGSYISWESTATTNEAVIGEVGIVVAQRQGS